MSKRKARGKNKKKGEKKSKSKSKFLTFENAKELLIATSPRDKGAGVYYDAGWGDRGQKGRYTVNGFEGQEISQTTYKQLYENKVIGGNKRITYKAQKWHPVLRGGKKDESQLGLSLFREKPFKTRAQLKREDASKDVYGLLEVKKSESGSKVEWKEISGKVAPENLPKDRVLCSNNIEATLNDGTMSHIWEATLVVRGGEVIGLKPVDYWSVFPSSSDTAVWRVSYWAPIPMADEPGRPLKLISKTPYISAVFDKSIF